MIHFSSPLFLGKTKNGPHQNDTFDKIHPNFFAHFFSFLKKYTKVILKFISKIIVAPRCKIEVQGS